MDEEEDEEEESEDESDKEDEDVCANCKEGEDCAKACSLKKKEKSAL